MLVPYATIVNGQPYVSFKFIVDRRVENTSSQEDDQDIFLQEDRPCLQEEHDKLISVDDFENYSDQVLDELDDSETKNEDTIMQRRLEAQKNYQNSFHEIDELQRDISKQISSADLTSAASDSNVHEILMDPVFGNMNNEEKRCLKKKAAEEVIKTIDADDPEFDTVFCKKMDEWLLKWADERKKRVDNYMHKFKAIREIEPIQNKLKNE